MSADKEELRRLLTLYRKGHISEEMFVEQVDEMNGAAAAVAGESDSPSAPPDEPGTPAAESEAFDLVAVLDGYRAAESAGAETLEAWAGLTADATLAGGLRTMAAREAAHAFLLEVRVRELGGEPQATVPDWLAGYNKALLDPDASDRDRLAAIVAQFPDADAALAPLRKTIDAIDGDELTREMLRTIGEDEAASIAWFHEAFVARKDV